MRIGLIGYGRMGQAIERIATARGHTVAGIIRRDTPLDARLQFAQQSDALSDFSHADAVPANVALARTAVDPRYRERLIPLDWGDIVKLRDAWNNRWRREVIAAGGR